MKVLKTKLARLFKRIWPHLLITLIVFIFFYPVWLKRLIPLPADFIVGTYRPWLDYKWGYLVGVPVKNPVTSDVVSVIYPLRSYAVDQIKWNQIPLWFSGMFSGYPLLANFQAAILSPTMVYYFFLTKIDGWTLQIITQTFLAVLLMYFFLRHLQLRKFACIFGGLIYGFSAFNIIWLEWNAHSLVAAWIPLILLALDNLIITQKGKWGILLAVSVALQILSGYPQVAVYAWLAVVLLIIFRFRLINIESLFKIGIYFLLGLGMSAVQTLPALELFKTSQRVGEFLNQDLRYFPFQSIITLFAPDFFGNPATGNYWGVGNYTIQSAYAGIIPLTLSVVGFLRYRESIFTWYFLFLIGLTLFLVLPTPITKIIYESPNLGMSALSPTRMLILVNLGISVLSAFGINSFFTRKSKIDIRSCYLPLVVLLGTFFASSISLKIIPQDYYYASNLRVGLRNLFLPFLLTLGYLVVVTTRNKFFPRFKNLFLIIIFLLVGLELFRFGWKYTPFSERSMVFPDTPITLFLKDKLGNEPFRISPGDVIPMNMWVPYGFESPSGYDAVFPSRWSEFINSVRTKGAFTHAGSRYADFQEYDSDVFDLLNVKYVISQKYDNRAVPDINGQISYKMRLPKLKKVFEDKSVAILENSDYIPRAFVVYSWETETPEKVLKKMISGDFPIDKKIFLEEDFKGLSKNNQGTFQINYAKYSANEMILQVDTSIDGLLFTSDLYYPGWEAFVDGKPEKILQADYTFRAVPVKEGSHDVRFIYQPKSFRIGKWISLSTFLILLFTWFYEQFTKKGTKTS